MAIAAIAVTAVASAGYGVYAGERAKAAQQRAYNEAKTQAEKDRIRQEQQMADNERRQQELYDKQVAEQKATQERVRGELPGMKERLGSDLLTQQEAAYARMTPQMEARLNALGLLQSGALPEAQAKAQKDLEMQRQAALSDFSTNAERQISIDQPYADMNRNIETSQTNLAQTFANQNAFNQNQTNMGNIGSLVGGLYNQGQGMYYGNMFSQPNMAGINQNTFDMGNAFNTSMPGY